MNEMKSIVVLSDEQLLHQFKLGDFNSIDANGWNMLMQVLYKKENILTDEQLLYLMKKTNLLHCDGEGSNALMIAFNSFKALSPGLYDYLLTHSDLNQLHKYSKMNALMLGLERSEASYTGFSLNLSQWEYLIDNTNLKQVNIENSDAMQYAFRYHNKLSKLQIQKLLDNCDISLKSNSGLNALMYACIFNKRNNLNLSQEQWECLIEKSDISCCNPLGNYNALSLALKYNEVEELKLKKHHFLTIIDKMQLMSEKGEQLLLMVLKSLCKDGVVFSSFTTLWDYFDDKSYLLNFIEKQGKDYSCYLQWPEIVAFKEKKLLEQNTVNAVLNNKTTKIKKI